jgi:hypothetical protein
MSRAFFYSYIYSSGLTKIVGQKSYAAWNWARIESTWGWRKVSRSILP